MYRGHNSPTHKTAELQLCECVRACVCVCVRACVLVCARAAVVSRSLSLSLSLSLCVCVCGVRSHLQVKHSINDLIVRFSQS